MEEEISKRGVSLAKQAVSTLRKNRCSLDLAQQVLDHFDKGNGCWNAGALFVRLQALHTDQDPASHWPPQAVTRTQVEQSAYAYLDKRDTAREALLAEQRAEQQRVQDLETKHGDVIDMLDKDGIKELIKQAYPEQTDFHLVRFRRSGLTAAFRYELLVYLESRNGSDMTEI